MISLICEKYKIKNYTINPDGTIDVTGNVDLSFSELTELPLVFNKVSGSFRCSNNRLTSLKGSPKWVGRGFYCSRNQLTSLEFGPEYVGGDFFCGVNKLTTLKGSPKWVGDYFDCGDNKLTSLEFSPDYVGGNFGCSDNDLSDLFGSPKEVGGNFYCQHNRNLINPKGCSEKIGKEFNCYDTPIGYIFNYVDQFFLHAFNFYKIIKDDTVNLKRLKYVMGLYDKPIDLNRIEKYYRII